MHNGYTIAEGEKPVFVHGALPGETIEARILKQTTGHSFALAERILKPSELRLASDCPVFPECGGCSFRHMSYEEELKTKNALLSSMGFSIERIVAADPQRYRTHVRVHGSGGRFGFYGLFSNKIVPMPEGGCANLTIEMNRAVAAHFRRKSGRGNPRDGAVFRLNHDGSLAGESMTVRLPDGKMWELPAGAFVQANRFLLDPWMRAIAERTTGRQLLELYCGSGLLGGFLAGRFAGYVGADVSGRAIEAGRANFKRFGLSGVFHCMDLEKECPEVQAETVLVNPARAGLSKLVRQKLAESAAGRIVYSSCNASTLRRDLNELLKAGFRESPALVFDFFPRTPHTELVVWLER